MPGVTTNDESNCTEQEEEQKIVSKVGRQLILLRCKFHSELYGMKNVASYKNSIIIKSELPHCARHHKIVNGTKENLG